MRKVFYTVFIVAFVAVSTSCSKNSDHASKQIVIDTSLASGADYFLNLQPYGDADDLANIIQQASAYTTSEIVNTPDVFAPVYHYSSETKSGLTDHVVISIIEGKHGNMNSRPHSDSTTITINFTIK